MSSAPFVVGQWVRAEKFYGRTTLIDEILQGNRNWVWLLGTRRIGKTSLLKQIEFLASSAADSQYFPVFWDFQGADDPQELHRAFAEALLDAEERLERLRIDPDDLRGVDLFDSLGRLRRKLRASNLKLLLLCDEVEELIKLHHRDPALLRKLRRVMQSQEDIRSVLASTIRLWALADERGDTSPFLHGFTPPLYIHRLDDSEALELIRQTNLPDTLRPAIDGATADLIRRRCDNHPYLMQLVCKRYLEVGEINEAIEQVASDQMVSYFFAVDFEMLSPTERDIIRIIAESSTATSDSLLDRISVEAGELAGNLRRLEDLGYLTRNPERKFELVNFFFRRWFHERPHSRLPWASTPSETSEKALDSEKSTESGGGSGALFDGRYRLLGELGKGATGVVYRARDEMVKEMIAIKLLKPEYSSNAEALERFRREILLARDINHANVGKIHHLGECRGQKYLAMKLIEGRTLAKVISSKGPMDHRRVTEVGRKLASALEAAHSLKVIHRDIKPQNILIDDSGEPFLTDFGLARLMTAPGMTQAGIFLGTPDYASPEQASLLPANERSDIYSLGVVMFEMATATRPFTADTVGEVLRMHKEKQPVSPRHLRPSIPESLARIILRCLEKEPARRFSSARELRVELEGTLP